MTDSSIWERDNVQQTIMSALSTLSFPVSQQPGDASAETYVTFNEVSCTAIMASDGAQRLRHLVQLHAYTHSENDLHRQAFFTAIRLLNAAGIKVYSYGPDTYEKDTGIHHIACTCYYYQK